MRDAKLCCLIRFGCCLRRLGITLSLFWAHVGPLLGHREPSLVQFVEPIWNHSRVLLFSSSSLVAGTMPSHVRHRVRSRSNDPFSNAVSVHQGRVG